jgi:hypothetical protein
VGCNEAGLSHRIGSLLAPLRAPSPVDHHYALLVGHDGRVDVLLDHQHLVKADSRAHAVAWLLWHISQAVVEASGEYLLIHAAAVEATPGAVVLPAAPNAGKTTLTVALIRAGFDYLTDEVVALSAESERVLPFPRPLTLEPESFAALADLDPAASSWTADTEVPAISSPVDDVGEWRHVRAARIRPTPFGRASPPQVVVFPRYQLGVPTRLEPIGTAEALLELATNTFNLDRHGGQGLALLARVAERCSCFRLDVSELDEACRLLLTVVGGT